MRRFFVEPENITGAHALLTGNEARHIASVLRLAAGDAVTLFDGSGSYYETLITRVSPGRVETKIVAITPFMAMDAAAHPSLHLAIGLLKGKKMDFIIQKVTELGIASVRPFRSRFCAAPDPLPGRIDRWQRIAREACKQCNRPTPPKLHGVTSLEELLAAAAEEENGLKLIFWEEEGQGPLQEALAAAPAAGSAIVLVGPEGGFSQAEVTLAAEAGFQPVTLGRRILRAETAALAAAAILQHTLGNLQ